MDLRHFRELFDKHVQEADELSECQAREIDELNDHQARDIDALYGRQRGEIEGLRGSVASHEIDEALRHLTDAIDRLRRGMAP
jgi:hypothetical protein